MKKISALAIQAFTSILGSLGAGAAGGVTNDGFSQENAAPIAPGTSARWDSSALLLSSTRVFVSGLMTLSKNGGTLAAGDVVTFQLVRDTGGGTIIIGPQVRATAVANGADAIAYAELTWIDTSVITPGTSHTYGIRATITGGHTGGVLTDEASITVFNI
jgi:hypothetical protein